MQQEISRTKTPMIILCVLLPLIFIGILMAGIFMITFFVFDKMPFIASGMIYVGQSDDLIVANISEGRIFTSYNELQRRIQTDQITRADFEDYNYALVQISYDSCREYDLGVNGLKITNNKATIKVQYRTGCGVCAPEYLNYLIPVNKSLKNLYVDYEREILSSDESCGEEKYHVDKPLIYLYPEQETKVKVELGYPEKITTAYPKYNDSWQVLAQPSGNLIDLETGRNYYSLYWEGRNYPAKIHGTGFVVKGEDTAQFLEEKLAILGLSEREANEFIIYWLPRLEHNIYNYIYFTPLEAVDAYMPLNITPQPDSTIRVMMEFMPLSEMIEIEEQTLQTPQREGFTVVEWGGSAISE